MDAEKPFKVLWGIFAQSFETLEEAMEFCSSKVIRNECHFSEVVTEEYTYHEECRGSTRQRTVVFSCHKPIQVN